MKVSKQQHEESLKQLREWIKPGDTVHTILRHVSRSGMQRTIGLVIAKKDGTMIHPNWHVANVTGYSLDPKREGLKIGGCGMDMGFALVYDLSRRLFPDGFGIEGEGPRGNKITPRSREHASDLVAAGVKFHGRNGDTSGWDDDGGYALKHRWL